MAVEYKDPQEWANVSFLQLYGPICKVVVNGEPVFDIVFHGDVTPEIRLEIARAVASLLMRRGANGKG